MFPKPLTSRNIQLIATDKLQCQFYSTWFFQCFSLSWIGSLAFSFVISKMVYRRFVISAVQCWDCYGCQPFSYKMQFVFDKQIEWKHSRSIQALANSHGQAVWVTLSPRTVWRMKVAQSSTLEQASEPRTFWLAVRERSYQLCQPRITLTSIQSLCVHIRISSSDEQLAPKTRHSMISSLLGQARQLSPLAGDHVECKRWQYQSREVFE